ncbi:MAG: hypothetical protein ACLQPH_10955 [Acidimicrobiales bacterium]
MIAVVDFEIHHQKITKVTVWHAAADQFDESWTDWVQDVGRGSFPVRGAGSGGVRDVG